MKNEVVGLHVSRSRAEEKGRKKKKIKDKRIEERVFKLPTGRRGNEIEQKSKGR